MEATRLPPAVLAAAGDRQGGAAEVAAGALDGLLEIAADPPLLDQAITLLLTGQPAMAPIWHLASAARSPDPPTALAALRRRLDTDTEAAVATATAWLHQRLAGAASEGAVATVSHSSLVDRVLSRAKPASSGRRLDPRWRSGADAAGAVPTLSTAPVVGIVGADAIGPEALLNAVGTGELAARVPTLVVATAIKLVPGEVFERLGGPGFEVVPLGAVAAVVVGPELLSPAEAGRRARELSPGFSRGRP